MSAAEVMRDTGYFRKVLKALDEGQRRWLVGREALLRGRGGVQRMIEVSGMSKPTILKGMRELRERREFSAEGRANPQARRRPEADRGT